MITGMDIVKEARKHLGTPFHHQGRMEGVGIDCIGLLVLVARGLGISVKDCTTYRRKPDGKQLIARLKENCEEIAIGEMSMGDIPVFWFRRPHLPQHVGIMTDCGIIHTNGDAGKVSEHIFDERWKKRLHSAFRFRGL